LQSTVVQLNIQQAVDMYVYICMYVYVDK